MWIPEKPKVYMEYGYWTASLEHEGWTEYTDFETWEAAMEHALWIGLNAGVWKL